MWTPYNLKNVLVATSNCNEPTDNSFRIHSNLPRNITLSLDSAFSELPTVLTQQQSLVCPIFSVHCSPAYTYTVTNVILILSKQNSLNIQYCMHCKREII